MKKSKLTKLIAVVLVLAMLSASFGAVTAGASSAYPILSSSNPIGILFADIVDTLLRILTDFLAGLFGNGPGFVDPDDPTTEELIASNYYEGTGPAFQKEAQSNAKWRLGYSNASLIPEDYDNGTYYIGGYISLENGFTNVVEGIAEIPGLGKDDMKVRCMAIDDNTGRGTVLFAVIDCIGITNADIKDIRALLADYAAMHNIVAINVSSTHTHSCIDTEGLWTKNIAKLVSNGVISGTQADGKLQQGTNPAYMAWLKERVADALIAAHRDIKAGSLTYTTKDLGQDYFQNKNRPSSGEIVGVDTEGNLIVDSTADGFKSEIAMTNIERFIFTPEDTSATPTMIINIAAHPDVAGLPTESNSGREISGDYIFYCEKLLNEAGYNFIFFQGAIAGIYMSRTVTGDNVETKQRVEESQRYGFELARMALALNKTEEEVSAEAWNENSDIYAELVENAKQIPAFDENGKAVEQVTTAGNNYTVLIDAQGKTVDIKDNTIKILDGDKVLYELNYTADETIAYEEAAQSYAVSNSGRILAIIVTGEGKKVVCPNEHTIVLYSEETSEVIAQLPVGNSRIVAPYETVTAVENGVVNPYAITTANGYTFVADAAGLNVAANNSAHTLKVTDANGDTVYDFTFTAADYIVHYSALKAYVVVDAATATSPNPTIIAAVSYGADQTVDISQAGKIILRDANGAEITTVEIGEREIITADTQLSTPTVDGTVNTCQINPLYSVWFENWNKNNRGADVVPVAQPVDPFLNLYITQVEVPISNTLITAIGKLNMANYVVKAYPDGSYTTVTEIGYMEWGKQFKTVFLPGEICQDIVALNGASLLAVNSITGSAFSEYVDNGYTSAAAIFGEDVKCFGVMNDAIGYVVPDNDYTMGDPANHYHELISLGQHVGSALIDGLAELKAEIDANTAP